MPFWNDGMLLGGKKDKAVDIDEVFATTTYQGSSSTQHIDTGINITGWTSTLNYGDPLQGGFYGGLIKAEDDGEVYALIVSPKSVEDNNIQINSGGTIVSTVSRSNGYANTIAQTLIANSSAANYCKGLTTGGYTDWYIGAIDEYQVIYTNLKPSTGSTSIAYGINTNSIPIRLRNYIAADVTQTGNFDFKSSGSQCFDTVVYWTSTQYSPSGYMWALSFANGVTSNDFLQASKKIRPIRRVNVKDLAVKHLFQNNTGMNWIKARTYGSGIQYNKNTALFDSYSVFNTTAIPVVDSYTTEDTTGFNLVNSIINSSSYNYAAWSFKKSPKFFDVIFYTGDGTANRQISHELGCEPGLIIVKSLTTAASYNWTVWSKPAATTVPPQYLYFNATSIALAGDTTVFPESPSDKYFFIGSKPIINASDSTFLAYVFAHDDSPSGVIKTGSYVGTGAANQSVEVGWEPQFVMVKNISGTSNNWAIFDNKREGILFPNTTAVESLPNYVTITPTGFKINTFYGTLNTNGQTYMYMAIRKKDVPNDVRRAFSMQTYTGGGGQNYRVKTGSVDLYDGDGMIWTKCYNVANYGHIIADTVRGLDKYLYLSSNTEERTYASLTVDTPYSYILGKYDGAWYQSSSSYSYISYVFQKTPKFFDIVTWTGDGSIGDDRVLQHGLGVEPGMYMVKSLDAAGDWYVWHRDAEGYFNTPSTSFVPSTSNIFTADSSTVTTPFNASGVRYVMYLFAHDPSSIGNIQCGTYTGNGSTSNGPEIDLGWEPQFVLFRVVGESGSIYVVDNIRSPEFTGADNYLLTNTPDLQVAIPVLETLPGAGFKINSGGGSSPVNAPGKQYVYMAIRKPSE